MIGLRNNAGWLVRDGITMWFGCEVQRDMTDDEQQIYDTARADELNRMGTSR